MYPLGDSHGTLSEMERKGEEMKKRFSFITLPLAVLMLLMICCCGVSAATTGPWDISAAEDNSVTATVVKNADNETYTLKVTASGGDGVIRDFAVHENPGWRDAYGSKITAVEIGSGIAEIGEYAFYQLTAVSKLTVKGDVDVIKGNAFFGLGSGVEDAFRLDFRGNVGTLAPSSFYNAGRQAGKIDILFAGDIGTVSEDAFSNLGYELGKNQTAVPGYQGHLYVTVGGDTDTLCYHCFFNAALNASYVPVDAEFSFGGDVGNIEEEAFKGLLNNAADSAERAITLKFEFDGRVYRWQESAFDSVGFGLGAHNAKSICSFTLAESPLSAIPARCFKSFGSRTEITLDLPALTLIGEEAFQYCGSEAFTLNLNGAENTLPAGVKYVAPKAFGWVGTPVTVPASLKVAVGEKAFDQYAHPAANWTTCDADPAFTPRTEAIGETGVTVKTCRAADGSVTNLTRGEILTVLWENDGTVYRDEELYINVLPDGAGNVAYLSVPDAETAVVWNGSKGYYTRDFRYFRADKDVTALKVGVYAQKTDINGNVTMEKVAEAAVPLAAPDIKAALTHVYGGLFVGDTVSLPDFLRQIGIACGEGLTVSALTSDTETVLSVDGKNNLQALAPGNAELTFSGKLAKVYGGGEFTDAVLRVEVIAKPEMQIAATSVKCSDNPYGGSWEYALEGENYSPLHAVITVTGLTPGGDYRLLYRKNRGTEAEPLYTVFPLPFTTVAGYDIQIKSASHGSVSAPAAAVKGETVTVTPYPDENYDLLKLEVKDTKGREVPVYDLEFIMPDCGVVITPTFTAADYRVTAAATEHGAVALSKAAALAGSTVKIYATPEEFYKVGAATVQTANGAKIPVNADLTFTMPAENVEVTVTFLRDSGVSRWLETVQHNSYVGGYSDGTVHPNGNLTRAEAAKMFYSLLLTNEDVAVKTFTDVTEDLWYYRYVGVMAGLGVIKGYEDGTFRGDRHITRAEFTAIAVRFAYEMTGESDFIDVEADFWGKKAIDTAVGYKWISGYGDGTFRPAADITRAEAITIINRMLERSADELYVNQHSGSLKAFSDLTPDMWCYYQIAEACNSHDYTKDEKGNEIWRELSK